MCGIIGSAGRIPNENVMEVGINTLKHRGPDDSGLFHSFEEGITLGHTRLSIIDLSSAGHEPFESNNGRYIITYNGEGFPNSIIECMSHGCVIISTPVGSIPDIIINEKNGYLVNPSDIRKISSILKILNDNIIEKISKNNFTESKEKYGFENGKKWIYHNRTYNSFIKPLNNRYS